MRNNIKKFLICTLFVASLFSCVNDSYNTPKFDNCINPGLTKTIEVSQIYTTAINPVATAPSVVPNTPIYTADDIIEAYVISSDEGGNFYKSMYFQPTNGSKGFNLSIDEANVYAKNLQPGKKVYLKLKGLAYANPTSFGNGLIFGAAPTEQFAVDRIASLDFKKFLVPSCDAVSEDAIVNKITIAQAVNGAAYLNTLVEIDDVQFTDESAGGTYDSNRTDDFDSSIFVTNGITNLTVRTSRFANFAGYPVPAGKGKLKGVLTKYGSTYQIIMRTERDAKMPNPRVDFSPALVGTNSTVFPTTVNETFEGYSISPAQNNFPNYINDAYRGTRYWGMATFGGNKYIQMTSFGSGGINKTYFFVPVDMTAANNFSFKSNMGFYNGAVLNVYYALASNYTAGGTIDTSKMVNITSKFTIPASPTSGYGTTFTSSGVFAIPTAVTGNGYFVFEYAGDASASPAITTTVQLDNILVN